MRCCLPATTTTASTTLILHAGRRTDVRASKDWATSDVRAHLENAPCGHTQITVENITRFLCAFNYCFVAPSSVTDAASNEPHISRAPTPCKLILYKLEPKTRAAHRRDAGKERAFQLVGRIPCDVSRLTVAWCVFVLRRYGAHGGTELLVACGFMAWTELIMNRMRLTSFFRWRSCGFCLCCLYYSCCNRDVAQRRDASFPKLNS